MRCSGNLESSAETSATPTTPMRRALWQRYGPDMAKFQELELQSDEGQKAMREDGLKVETMRMLVEFTP
jgi:hypothetical protein